MSVFLLCAAILLLFYGVLSANVSRMRRRQRRDPGVTEAQLTKAIRAHGNAAEYVPLFVAVFLYLHVTQGDAFAAIVAIVATASRISHAAGVFVVASVAERHPLRFFGAAATYVCLFAFGGVLLARAF